MDLVLFVDTKEDDYAKCDTSQKRHALKKRQKPLTLSALIYTAWRFVHRLYLANIFNKQRSMNSISITKSIQSPENLTLYVSHK